jgi:hypothetical protein
VIAYGVLSKIWHVAESLLCTPAILVPPPWSASAGGPSMTAPNRKERRRRAHRLARDRVARRRLAAAMKGYDVQPDGTLKKRPVEPPPGKSRTASGLIVVRDDIATPEGGAS